LSDAYYFSYLFFARIWPWCSKLHFPSKISISVFPLGSYFIWV
jgi:hypothetical protein